MDVERFRDTWRSGGFAGDGRPCGRRSWLGREPDHNWRSGAEKDGSQVGKPTPRRVEEAGHNLRVENALVGSAYVDA